MASYCCMGRRLLRGHYVLVRCSTVNTYQKGDCLQKTVPSSGNLKISLATCNLTRLKTLRTNIHLATTTVDDNGDMLNIWTKLAIGNTVGVAN